MPKLGRLRAANLFALLALVAAASANAQTPDTLRGRIVDTEGSPLAGHVEVVGTRRRTEADANGSFRIAVGAGTWTLVARHPGYRTDSAVVTLPGPPPADLVFRLQVVPVALAGLTVDATGPSALTQTVTTETIRQVPPVGEPDVFRAVVLLPGVAQPNDLKGRIHLAGGSSDETGVRLDGHPLQDPFHLLGLSGAFNVAALESADVRIHDVPAGIGNALSGVIDMRTRHATGAAQREVVAGLLSTSGTWAPREQPGGLDVLASGRVTYLDKVVEFLSPRGGAGGDDFPLVGYRDLLLRVGKDSHARWRTEALLFHTRDNLRSSSVGTAPHLAWGETLVGVTARRDAEGWTFASRASLNRAGLHTYNETADGAFARNSREWASAAATLARRFPGAQAELGLSLDSRTISNAWKSAGLSRQIFSPRTPEEFAGRESLTEIAAFGELQSNIGPRTSASAGARIVAAESRAYLAPRLLLTHRIGPRIRVEGALSRRLQFDAELEEPIEGNVSPPKFLLERPRHADVAAVSADWRFAGTRTSGSVQTTLFAKWYGERPVLRDAGAAGPEFPDFVRTDAQAMGASVSARWAEGTTWLVQGSYTFQRARERIENRWYPTSWDAPHDLSLFASARVFGSWDLNAVYRAHSGRATTPVEARVFVSYEEFENYLRTRYIRGERNSVRVPGYHRLDIGARRSWSARQAEWTLFIQVLNVLWQDNPIDYDWFQFYASQADPSITRYSRRGLPLLPTAGLEVRW